MGSWYNPLSWGDESDSQKDQRNMLIQQGNASSAFGGKGANNYALTTGLGQGALSDLYNTAHGENSVSAEQLRQALQQNINAQRSMAAGADPRNAAAAARTAAIQSARLGAGLAGQQAAAGLQERQQAQQAYGSLLQGLRGQDVTAALGGQQNATAAYGGYKPEGSFLDKWGPAIIGGVSAASSGGATKSDRRAKKDIGDGDGAASKAVEGLKAYVFKYKSKRDGVKPEVGVMAQDLERVGLGHAVIDTPDGKVVHGAKLATSNTAMIAALGRRVRQLEGGKRRSAREDSEG